MEIREMMKKKFVEKFGEFGLEYEQALHDKSYYFTLNKNKQLSWKNEVFLSIYYENCNEIYFILEKDKKIDPKKLMKYKIEDLVPEYKKFLKVPTPLGEQKTIDYFCVTCKRITKNFAWSKQTRSADEGKTNFYKCQECGQTSKE